MHELAIAEAIADVAERRAGGRPLTAVAIRVGHLRQVVPDALAFSWMMITDATALAGCRLDIEEIVASVRCGSCGTVSVLETPLLLCPSCGGSGVTVVTGDEFVVVSLELAEV